MNRIYLLLLFLFFHSFLIGATTITRFSTDFETNTNDSTWVNKKHCISDSSACSGGSFYRLPTVEPYGIGVSVKDTNLFLNKNISVKLNATTRLLELTEAVYWVVSIKAEGKEVFWTSINLNNRISELNKWIELNDSVLLPASLFSKKEFADNTYATPFYLKDFYTPGPAGKTK